MKPKHTRVVNRFGRLLLCPLLLSFFLILWSLPNAFAQPPVPHDEEDNGVSYEDCVYCHRVGEDDAPLLAADHVQHENADCRVCHSTTGMLEAPRTSHPVAGWADCRGCHDRWEYNEDGGEIDIPNLADSDYDHAIYENGTCVSCHPVATVYYEEMPPVACGVCHPESATAETVHNGPAYWVDCVDCHQAAGSYPHDAELIRSRDEDCLFCHNEGEGHWMSDRPDKRYNLADHIARGDPHAWTDCVACHLQVASVERNAATNRIQVVLPETEEGVPPDNPELAAVVREVDCQRCHIPDNTVAAPVTELPPRSILCLACHDGTPVVKDGLSWAGIGIFGLGMLMTASVWLQGSIGGRQGLSLPARLGRILVAFLDLVTTPRLFILVWSFIVDGILHRKLFHKSKLHWLTHAFMFFGMMARMALGVFTWLMALLAPAAHFTQILVNKSSPAIAIIYDGLGLLVIAGAVLAIVRRYIVKDEQFITGGQDTVAIALIGAIFLMGFVTEGVRILTTALEPSLAAFSFVGYVFSLVLGVIPANWGVVYGWLWYIHAGLVAALVAYLPFSKFIHVLIGPVVAAFNSALEARVA
jgi:predicted CXXCH cytochrome family protein